MADDMLGEFLSQNQKLSLSSFVKPSAAKVSRWHEVHGDLLRLFARKFSLADRITLNLVCKSWRSWKGLYILSAHEMPLLVLHREPNCPYLRLFSLSRGEIENFRLPKSFQKRCYIGSSNGWLTFEGSLPTKTCKRLFFLFLFNPISCTVLRLPSLPISSKPVSNVTVSSSQVSETLMVAAIIHHRSWLVVCRPSDKVWSKFVAKPTIAQNPCLFADVLFQGDTLFVLCEICHRGSIPQGHYSRFKNWGFMETIAEISTSTLKTAFISVSDPLITKYEDREYYGSAYLTSSTKGELMMVIRWCRLIPDQENPQTIYSCMENIIMYKVFFGEGGPQRSWVKDIDDQILFLGRVHSQMLSSKILNETRRNCIIFTEDCNGLKLEEQKIYGQLGVYNFENNTKLILGYNYINYHPFYLDWFLPMF